MPRNKSGGSRFKRIKNVDDTKARKAEDIAKDSKKGELYGRVVKEVGNRRFIVFSQPLKEGDAYLEINCGLKGSYRKRISGGQYVLLQNWEFERGSQPRGTIIDGYTDTEVKKMEARSLWDFNPKSKKEEIFEFISKEDDADRKIHQDNANERLGPQNLLDDESDDDAI